MLVKDVRPQWRQLYRPVVQRAPDDRFKAALGLGAVCADLYLAAESRDAARIANLLTDLEALERLLGIGDKSGHSKQTASDLGAGGDWPGVRKEIAGMVKNHRRYLSEHRDDPLADLEEVAMWMRTLQIGAGFSAAHKVWPPQAYAHWPPVLARLEALSVSLCANNKGKSLSLLKSRLVALNRLWKSPPAEADLPARTAESLTILDMTMSALIDDLASDAPKKAADAARKD